MRDTITPEERLLIDEAIFNGRVRKLDMSERSCPLGEEITTFAKYSKRIQRARSTTQRVFITSRVSASAREKLGKGEW